MNVQEKIEYEYRCFFLDMMRTSKENIFAHSKEIEIKKDVTTYLMKLVDAADDTILSIMRRQDSVLNSAYCFWMDRTQKFPEKKAEEVMAEWLASLALAEKSSAK